MLRSTNNGRTWTSESKIFEWPDPLIATQPPCLTATPDGQLISLFFTWHIASSQDELPGDGLYRRQVVIPEKGMWAQPDGPYLLRSRDGGHTWDQKPERLKAGLFQATALPMIVLQDGTWLIPVYGKKSPNIECDQSAVLRSTNGGVSWETPIIIAEERSVSFHEPALLEMSDGGLLCVMRTAGDDDHLWQCQSMDGGKSWTDPLRTQMVGHPAHLLLTTNSAGDEILLCTYGFRHKPYGIRACISFDGARSWDVEHELVLRDDGYGVDLGYPMSLERQDGSILTTYYFSDRDGLRFLSGSIYRL